MRILNIGPIAVMTLAAVLSGSPLDAADIDVAKILRGVEQHYNNIKTLQVAFSEKSSFQGRSRTETGELYLRKPGRMRWNYTSPAGKVFVSDGKYIYMYTPSDNQYERMPMKETEDMRAPLAFLLGRLNFNDDFKEFRAQPDNRSAVFITAVPKSDKMPYTEVTFLVTPDDSVIHWLRVRGQDGTDMEYSFENEKKNPPLKDALFHFPPPPGAQVVDTAQGN